MYSRKCWNIPRARIPLWWKCYFPQIVWFTVNEFSLPIIIWRSFRSPPDHRGLCCRKHERKYLEISAFLLPSISLPPSEREWGKLSIDKRDLKLQQLLPLHENRNMKEMEMRMGEKKMINVIELFCKIVLDFAPYPDDKCYLPNNCYTRPSWGWHFEMIGIDCKTMDPPEHSFCKRLSHPDHPYCLQIW